MHFAYPLPWWLAIVLAAGIAAVAFAEYRRPLSPLTRPQRATLVALRVATLAVLVLFLFRPIVMLPPAGNADAIVPILVDTSRSMRLADADGQTRLARASALVKTTLQPALGATRQNGNLQLRRWTRNRVGGRICCGRQADRSLRRAGLGARAVSRAAAGRHRGVVGRRRYRLGRTGQVGRIGRRGRRCAGVRDRCRIPGRAA